MDFNKIIKRITGYWNTFKNHILNLLKTAFPQTKQRNIFLAAIAAVILLLAYAVAALDVGLWSGDCSIHGMVATYIMTENTYPWGLFILLSAIFLMILYVYLTKDYGGNTGRGFNISKSNVYGSAQEITREDLEKVAEIVPIEEAFGTILGKMDKTDKNLITTKPNPNFNKNSFILAPPGSGKTHCIVIPQIVQAIIRGESIVTTDTKGELWAKTVELARSHGYIVRRIDFKDPEHSDGWDILSEVRHSPTRAKIAASIFIANTGSDKDIHAAAEENLLAALALYTDLNNALSPEEKSLYNTYTMLLQGPSALDAMFTNIQDDPEMRVAYDFYGSFQGSDNLRGNIIAGLAKRLNILADPGIRELTSTPDIDLTLPGKKKCIYYIELPDQHGLVRFLSSLLFSFLFLDLTDYADSRLDQKLPVPVNVIVEEAFAVGRIETLTNALATMRSRGVGITLIAQGIPQFKELYGDNVTEIIQECCATFGCLSANGETTSEFFAWLSGNATVDVKSEHHVVGEGPITFGRSYTTGQGRQELFSSNDVRKTGFGQILLVWQRMNPKMAYTFGIDEHPEMINGHMPLIMPTVRVSIHDKEARAFFHAHEEARVATYEEWVKNGGDPWPDYRFPKNLADGPNRDTPLPKIIPYAELEDMALAHSAQASTEASDQLMRELQQEDPIPPEDDFELQDAPYDLESEPHGTYTDNFDSDGIKEDEPPAPVVRPNDSAQASRQAQGVAKTHAQREGGAAPQNGSQGTPQPKEATNRQSGPTILDNTRTHPKPKQAEVPSTRDLFGLPGDEVGSHAFEPKAKEKEDRLKSGTTKIKL